jgi:hypothetical protein
MSLLPQRILPQTEPWGKADADGTVTIDKNWWLFLYNLGLQTLGTGGGLPTTALIELAALDADAADTDAVALRQPIANLNAQLAEMPPTAADFPDIARALLLAQDVSLPDPPPQAQPAVTIVVGASPFTYTASFNGSVAISGGTVSLIQLIRQTTTVATGVIAGLIPVSRLDQIKITHTGAPVAIFLPT